LSKHVFLRDKDKLALKIPRLLNVSLSFALVVGIACALLAHENSLAREALCRSTSICIFSANAAFWNKLIYDFGMGSLISLIFYGLLVKIPDSMRRRRIRSSLLRQYRAFKEDCLGVILGVVNESYSTPEIEALLNRESFRQYFARDPATKMSKWDDFLNKVQPHNVSDILTYLDHLRNEISFVINNVDIDQDEVFEFMKRIGRVIFSLRDSAADYDSIGPLAGFLWTVFTGWGGPTGYQEPDYIDNMLAAI
jgi:hypothetical protein